MCSPFTCTGSFKNWKDHDFDELLTPIQTQSRSKSYRSCSSRRKDSKNNPFANRGLDKFSALVEELEAKKQKIYTQKGSEDISLIYFTYTLSDEFKPFIVREKKQQDTNDIHVFAKSAAKDNKVLTKRYSIKSSSVSVVDDESQAQRIKKDELTSQNCRTLWNLKPKNCRHIFGCFSVTLVLILLLLVFSGRSFAILGTTVSWYVAPTLVTEIASVQKKTSETIP